jgi:hypothetical protein
MRIVAGTAVFRLYCLPTQLRPSQPRPVLIRATPQALPIHPKSFGLDAHNIAVYRMADAPGVPAGAAPYRGSHLGLLLREGRVAV